MKNLKCLFRHPSTKDWGNYISGYVRAVVEHKVDNKRMFEQLINNILSRIS